MESKNSSFLKFKFLKIGLIVFGVSALVVLLGMGGIRLFVKHIYNSNSCESFNIDNIELRTHIDIPDVNSVDCNCNENIKTAKFILEPEVEISRYIKRNNFEKQGDLFINSGERKDTKWNATLDVNTKELFIEIEYKKVDG